MPSDKKLGNQSTEVEECDAKLHAKANQCRITSLVEPTFHDDGRFISQNVASGNTLAHDV